MSDRRHIVEALRAMRAADLSLCTYAESGERLELDFAMAAARRLRRALARQRIFVRTNQTTRKEVRIMAKSSKGSKSSKGGCKPEKGCKGGKKC